MPSRRLKKVPINDLRIGDYAEISKEMTLDIVKDFSKISDLTVFLDKKHRSTKMRFF